MEVFHGSSVIVKKPILLPQQRTLDFGSGFYTTTNIDQATSFAQKVGKRRKSPKCYISIFDLERFEAMKAELCILDFSEPSEEWLDFVFENREGIYTGPVYDVILGPVANDTIYRVFTAYEAGIIGKEECIRQLKLRKLYNQVTFATEIALSLLNFKGYLEYATEGIENG